MNILQLGLDVDSFSADKKAKLQEFVSLFDTLMKYDGKTISPVMGAGLMEFNNSVKETNVLLTELNSKMSTLSTSMNSTTRATQNSTNATNSNTSANTANANSSIKAAEAQTRIAAAQTRTTSAAVAAAQANSTAANASVQQAAASDKLAASANAQIAARDLLSAAAAQEAAANTQSSNAVNQLIIANNALTASVGQDAAVQAAAQAAVTRGIVAVEAAAQAALRAQTAMTRANAEIASTSAAAADIVTASNTAVANSSTRVAESATKQAAGETRTAAANVASATSANRLAIANLAAANSFGKAAAQSAVQVTAQNLVASAAAQEAAAQQQATVAANQLTVAQNRLNASTSLTAIEQNRAAAAVTRAQIAVQQAAIATTRSGQATAQAMAASQAATNGATTSVNGLAKGATSALSALRTAAYILPGIGIAGIFNLAFEAISKAAEGLDIFVDKTERQIEFSKKLSEVLSEQFGIMKSISDQQEKVFQQRESTSSTNYQRLTAQEQAKGTQQGSINENKLIDAQTKLAEANQKIGGNQKATEVNIDMLLEQQKTVERKLQELQKLTTNPDYEKEQSKLISKMLPAAAAAVPEWMIRMVDMQKPIKASIDEQKAALELQKSINEKAITDYVGYKDSVQAVEIQRLENIKFIADQERKLRTETAKDNISLQITQNEAVLANDITSEQRRLNSLKQIYKEQRDLNNVAFRNVKDNNSSTPAEIEIAQNKLRIDNTKALLKYEVEAEKVRESYRQRYLKATTEINKNDIEGAAIANERVFKNEEKTLDERLKSYNIYISKKQTLQDLEYAKDKQALALRANDPTARKELEALESNRTLQRANIQADAEKQVFDIVSQSLSQRLKTVKDQNDIEDNENDKAYAKSLNQLNKSFEDKEISYRKYYAKRTEIDHRYRLSGFDEAIADDKRDIDRLRIFLDEQTKARDEAKDVVDITSNELKNSPASENAKRDADEALGKYNALNKIVLVAQKDLQNELEKLDDDELKRAKTKFEQLEKMHKEYASNTREIEEALFNLVRTYVDAQANKRLEALEAKKKTTDESYDSEIQAIQRSSLDAKNKAALDIQLAQQKKEFDKNAELESRKLKHDQAVLDRELTLAHIAWSTEEAIMAALALSFIDPITAQGLAIQRGILGAIAAATVLATDIPSYAEGTDSHPGGLARFGEAGAEVVKEPYKSPYVVFKETIAYLPKGTEVIPVSESPVFENQRVDNSWEQTRWLANQMKKNKQEIRNNINNVVKIDFKTEAWRRNILGN